MKSFPILKHVPLRRISGEGGALVFMDYYH